MWKKLKRLFSKEDEYSPEVMARKIAELNYTKAKNHVAGERFYYKLRNFWGLLLAVVLVASVAFQFWLTYSIGKSYLNFHEYKVFLGIVAGENFVQVVGLCLIVVGDYPLTASSHASIVATQEITPTVKTGDPIGIDLGLKHLAITSDGRKFEAMKPKKAQRKRMKTLQQSLCRKQKGSIRRARVKVDLARLHEKIKNRRANHLHKVSHQLASESQAVIVVEDLAVKNMMANHKLADVIADTGWGEFVRQLEYKQLWSGGTVEKIDRFFPSSKMCSSCSYIVGKLPLNIRVWQCPECSAEHDRDINAAKNLMKQWLGNSHAWRVRRVASSSDEVMVSGSMKRERVMMATSSI